MSFDDDDNTERSRADELLDEVKSSAREGQYRLSGMFGLMLLCAALLALPRLIGWRYDHFFGMLYILAYGCAPLTAWAVWWLIPAKYRSWRTVAALLVAIAVVVPCWVMMANDNVVKFVEHLPFIFGFIWLPQALSIAIVQYMLFRGAIKRRSYGVRRGENRD